MEGDWWTGTMGSNTGIFPANYVKKQEVQVRDSILKIIYCIMTCVSVDLVQHFAVCSLFLFFCLTQKTLKKTVFHRIYLFS